VGRNDGDGESEGLTGNLREAVPLDGEPGLAIEMAPVGEDPHQRAKGVLDPSRPGAGPIRDVLDEEEPPTGLQNAPDLLEGSGNVGNRAEDERAHDGVHTVVRCVQARQSWDSQMKLIPGWVMH